MTRVAILWHMHQPYYGDRMTGTNLLPWVRLHALKDYFGMVAILREFPSVHVTFNLVPSLVMQLEAYASGSASDPYLELGLKPAHELTERDALFMLQNFFHAQRHRMIEPYPRYAELLARRDAVAATLKAQPGASHGFSVDDLRDLQVWQKLAWIDPLFLDGNPIVRELIERGRQFTEADKAALRTIELEILRTVVPTYKEMAASGQVELTTSPFYHPILPLLCDTDIYKRTHPGSPGPRQRLVRPEDALEQLTRASAFHERLFGARPVGLWPSEGSVSEAMVPLAKQAGFHWMATDELVLARSLGIELTRNADGRLDHPEVLYRPYLVRAGESEIACLFRDHALSDRIGFSYSGWAAEAAADDFVTRLVIEGQRFSAAAAGEEAVIPIILDGENAWEHFEGGGRPFLRALYARLANHPDLQTVTMSEACRSPARELRSLFPGSWIDANFYVWIGHRDDQQAWSQLAEARDALDQPGSAPAMAVEQARDELFIAEGSDWFWWYGDDRSSEHDQDFDDLFRRHLRNVYNLLGREIPDELFLTNISTASQPPSTVAPVALLTPSLDGQITSYFEWLGAGRFEPREVEGVMHQTSKRAVIGQVLYAFDRRRLFVRLDTLSRPRDLLAEGLEFSLEFLNPPGTRLTLVQRHGAFALQLQVRQKADAARPVWVDRDTSAAAAVEDVIELAMPLADLTTDPADGPLEFFVTIRDDRGQDLERHPNERAIVAEPPDARFEAIHWRV